VFGEGVLNDTTSEVLFNAIQCFALSHIEHPLQFTGSFKEHINPSTLIVRDHLQREKLVLEHAEKMGCKRHLTAKDIVEGSPNLNCTIVVHIFQHK